MSSRRPAGSHSSSNSSTRDESGARRPVTGTTCHQLHHSPNGSPLDERHGRQSVAPPRRQFILHKYTHTHTHSCIHKGTKIIDKQNAYSSFVYAVCWLITGSGLHNIRLPKLHALPLSIEKPELNIRQNTTACFQFLC